MGVGREEEGRVGGEGGGDLGLLDDGEEEKLTVSQITTCESAGQPVQPAYCSSPKERTTMGLSRVPIGSNALY